MKKNNISPDEASLISRYLCDKYGKENCLGIIELAQNTLTYPSELSDDIAAAIAEIAAGTYPTPTEQDVHEEMKRRKCVLLGVSEWTAAEKIINNGIREAVHLQSIRIGVPGLIVARDWSAAEAARAAQLATISAVIDAIDLDAEQIIASGNLGNLSSDARWAVSSSI